MFETGQNAKVVAIHENIDLHLAQGGAQPQVGDVVRLTQYLGSFRAWAICEARGYGAYFPFAFLQPEAQQCVNSDTPQACAESDGN